MVNDRTTCKRCGCEVLINTDGRLRKHRVPDESGYCRGSGRPGDPLLDVKTAEIVRLQTLVYRLEERVKSLEYIEDVIESFNGLTAR